MQILLLTLIRYLSSIVLSTSQINLNGVLQGTALSTLISNTMLTADRKEKKLSRCAD